jgi:hypothetical protein
LERRLLPGHECRFPGQQRSLCHLLSRGQFTLDWRSREPLSQLSLQNAPWFDAGDIDFYDFSAHCIYLKNDKAALIEKYELGHFDPPLIDKPFVVLAGKKRCYRGCLRSGLLSTMPLTPSVGELDVWYYPRDVLHIERDRASSQDVRSDPDVREGLMRSGLFHGGLILELNSVTVLLNSDTSTVQYCFTLRNEDQDPLHVFDPDRTGSDLFHYYTNGVLFSSEQRPSIWSEYKTVAVPFPSDSWQPTSFTRVDAGQSIVRTVTLRGYPKIPQGVYTCRLAYSGPTRIEGSQRTPPDGRFWIGEIESRSIQVTID